MSILNVGTVNTTVGTKLPSFNNSNRPTGLDAGFLIFNTEEEVVQLWNGTVWSDVGGRPTQEYSTTFTYTGASQTFAIPEETSSVTAYVWGPGGGSEGNSDTRGGAGGYSVGTINVANGGTLKIIVGGAGAPGTQSNGSGGGYSGVFTNSWNGANASTDHSAAIIVAGGGGGSANSSSGSSHGGGAGGGFTGQKGNPSGSGGNPGTQTGGGAYAQTGGGSCTAGAQCSGTTLRGGVACGGAQTGAGVGWPGLIYGGLYGSAAGGNGCNAGGGGAGYWGGAGGGGSPNGGNGGGGSGYIGGSGGYTVSNGNTYTGNGQTPPAEATSNPYYQTNISKGGAYNTDYGNGNHTGGHGLVVLVYDAYDAVPGT